MDYLGINGAHCECRHCGEPCLIHLMDHVIEDAVVLKQVGIGSIIHRDLIRKSPDDYGRVVVVLHHQFLHLGDRVLTSRLHVL